MACLRLCAVFSLPAERREARPGDPLPGSMLWDEIHKEGFVPTGNHFNDLHPESDWKSCLEQAEKIGLGSRDYELIKVFTAK